MDTNITGSSDKILHSIKDEEVIVTQSQKHDKKLSGVSLKGPLYKEKKSEYQFIIEILNSL